MIITSDTLITDIDKHFKVSAGPGAGKTHWLVNHIKNVLHHSDKLFISKKVACITYTNIAVETILNRLGTSATQVEVSTIHSFLYKHIVKPYASFIAEEYSLDISKMDGHDETILSNYSFLTEWKQSTNQARIRDDNIVVEAFKKLQWIFDNDELHPRTPYPFRAGGYPIRNDSYMEYKKMAWGKGVIHHDDVLFFSYQIIKKFPFVTKVLSKKFPYFFIDEFQDSNPIQVEIFKKLAQNSSVTIGVIGDMAQSIYGFQGADYTQFQSFSLPNMQKFELQENRRSSNEIIDLLNYLRKDLPQVPIRNKNISKPLIYVGDMIHLLAKAQFMCGDEKIYTLSRQNITSNAMKAQINGGQLNHRLLEELKEKDSNKDRRKLIYASIRAVSYAKENKFKDAIKELEKLFSRKNDKLDNKKKALNYLTILLNDYDNYYNTSLLEFSNFVKSEIDSSIASFRSGDVKTFYQNNTFEQLSLCVSIPDDMSLHKTIHKAKGDEFDNVFVVLQEESHIDFLIEPKLLEDEEHRVYYVAVSRARNRLFISVPTLEENKRSLLSSYFEIQDINTT